MKVLIAEDDTLFRSLLGVVLREAGYEVLEAEDGAAAWERLAAEGADVCVFDVDMPGMTGIELLKRMRADEKFRVMPVLMLTVRGLVEDQLAGYEVGADDYLPKPVPAAILLAKVAALCRKALPRPRTI